MWFGADGIWIRRAAVTLWAADGSQPSAFRVEVPSSFDDFWDRIDEDGYELRVVNHKNQVANYVLQTWNYANRTCVIDLENVVTPAEKCMVLAWLYYGSSTPQGDAQTATAGTDPPPGLIELARPGGPYVNAHAPAVPGLSQPRVIYAKSSNELADVWTQLPPSAAWSPNNKAAFIDNIHYATLNVEDDEGSPQGGMGDLNNMRFVWIPSGGLWVRYTIGGGTHGERYTSSLVTHMVAPLDPTSAVTDRPIIDTRIGWHVQDVRLTS